MSNKKKLTKDVIHELEKIPGSGLKPSAKGPHHSKGESVDVKVLRETKAKRLTHSQKENFVRLAKERQTAISTIVDLKEDISRCESRLKQMTETYGVKDIRAGATKDLLLYVPLRDIGQRWTDPKKGVVEGVKGELIWNERSGAIHTEKIEEVFPELIDDGIETVNLSHLMKVIENYEVPASTKSLINSFSKIVAQLEKATGQTLIDKKDDKLLNIEMYEQYKQSGKISKAQVAEFEQTVGHYSFKIDNLVPANLRCGQCGWPKPKTALKNQKHTCSRCGKTE